MYIKFRVTNQQLRRVSYDTIVANSQDYLYAEFEFVTDDWNGVTRYVYFSDPAKNNPILLQLDEDNRVKVPAEMIALPSFMVNIVGNRGTMTISTNWIMLAVTGSGIMDGFAPMPSENPIINSKLDKSVFESYKEEATTEIDGKLDKSVFEDYKTDDTKWKTVTTENIEKLAKKITDILYNAPDAYDTFKEIADYIKSDKDGASALLEKVNRHDVLIENETQNRVNAESSLSGEIDNVKGDISDNTKAVTALKGDVTELRGDIGANKNAIDNEAYERKNADATLRNDFTSADTDVREYAKGLADTETERAEGVENGLDTRVTALETDITAITADTTAQLKNWIAQQGYITNVDLEEALGKEY